MTVTIHSVAVPMVSEVRNALHYVNAEAVECLILSSIQRLSKFVIEDEAAFAEQLRLKVKQADAVPVEKNSSSKNWKTVRGAGCEAPFPL